MEGSLKIESDGVEREYFAGDVAIFPKGVFQCPTSDSSVRYYFIHFSDDALVVRDYSEEKYSDELLLLRKSRLTLSHIDEKSMYDSIGILLKDQFSISKEQLHKISVDLENITKLLIRRNPRNLLRASYTLADILYSLEGSGDEIENVHTDRTRAFALVTRAAKYIEKNYTSDISIEKIAAELYINPDYLGRIFKKHIGCSMTQYKNRLRITAAKRMLMSTASNIDEIAFETGFSDRFYFSRIFKEIEGITPNEYRRNAYGINIQNNED